MKFSTFSTIDDALRRFNFPQSIHSKISNIFKKYKNSESCKKVIDCITANGTMEPLQIFKIYKFGFYDLDKNFYTELLNVTENGVGPGEILISLLYGKWMGGTSNDYDVFIKSLGKCEVKYLGPFVPSSHVPLGSSKSKNLLNSDFLNFLKTFYEYINKNLDKLKNVLSTYDLNYFLKNTLNEFKVGKSPTTKSFRIIGRILNKSDSLKNDIFKSGFTFTKFKDFMLKSLIEGVGESDYILFLGYKNIITTNVTNPSMKQGGIYLVLPKSNLKYYMFYKVYENSRVEIAPLETEDQFLKG